MDDRRIRRLSRRTGATLLTIGLALGGFGVFAPDVFAAPPDVPPGQDKVNGDGTESQGGGNNGTIKIGDIVVDGAPGNDNDPQVQCPLVIEWFGFDGAADTTATITPHNDGDTVLAQYGWSIPDTKTTPVQHLVSPDLSGAPQGPKGYHIRVTVETTTANGSDTKSKVIWVANNCGTSQPGPTSALVVRKDAVGAQPNASFGFSVTCGATTATPSTFSLGDDQQTTVTVAGVAGTDCVVSETDDGGADSTTWSLNGGGETTGTTTTVDTAAVATPPVVEFTNTFDDGNSRGSATLRIGKTVVGTGSGPFVFTVDCGESTVSPSTTVTVAAGTTQSVTVSAPPTGDCTITETNPGTASTAWSASDGGAGTGTVADVAIQPNETSSVTFVNTFTSTACTTNCPGGPGGETVIIPASTPTTLPASNPAPNLGPPQQVAPVTQVAGEQAVRPAPQPQPTVLGAQLARTGAATDRLILVAGACLLLGGIALAASRQTVAVPARRR